MSWQISSTLKYYHYCVTMVVRDNDNKFIYFENYLFENFEEMMDFVMVKRKDCTWYDSGINLSANYLNYCYRHNSDHMHMIKRLRDGTTFRYFLHENR